MSYLEDRQKRKNGLLPPLPTKKEKKPLKKVGDKKRAEINNASGDDTLDKWYEERRKEMTGKCFLCGGKTEKNNDGTYRRSIHHPLEKKLFPSVATHPENAMELCFWGNSCHTNWHNGTITWELLKDSKEWDVIIEKIKRIYPFIKEEEKKRLPDILRKELTPVEK